MIKLSKRMSAIAQNIEMNDIVADIGTDHGYLPIYLVEQGICKKAIAMDINEGPLLRAKKHIDEQGLTQKIDTRLSNGGDRLEVNEVSSIIIAGMGGRLIADIMGEKPEVFTTVEQLVLQPQSEWMNMRLWLTQQGYEILKEEMVCEEEKYYLVLKTKFSDQLKEAQKKETTVLAKLNMTEKMYFRYGRYFLKHPTTVFREFLDMEQKQKGQILERLNLARVDEKVRTRKLELVEMLRLNKMAMEAIKVLEENPRSDSSVIE